jgi:hypothetical protein
VIRFERGTFATFAVNFSSPIEQRRFCFSGTRGRLEVGYSFGAEGSYRGAALVHYPLFAQEPRPITVPPRAGGHGGGDPRMLEDICSDSERGVCRASARDGAYAVALGEGMWRSDQNGRPYRIAELLGKWY